ncbi:MAG: hypothetical protein NZ578_08650, partial [Candidatus Binatia bacterium]|nr:hypothetical protein [Candidatus Binatia bacterium]
MHNWQRWITEHPKSVLALVLLLTAFFASSARQIRFEGSVDSLLPADDPEKRYYQEARRLFGSEEVGVLGLVTTDVYTPRVLEKIRRLTEEISQIPEV